MAQRLREYVRAYLDDIDTPIGRAVNLAIAGLVLLSSAIFVAQTYSLPDGLRRSLDWFDRAILIGFAVEYLLRFWCAERRWRYLISFYSIIDLLAILPLVLGAFDIQFIRVFRWFRVLRLVRLLEGKTIIGYVTREDSAIFTRILMTLFIIIFVFSGLIYQVEHPINPERFGTFLDAMYFAVATMSTVGFGDVTPVSELGRFLTMLMILTGIVLIPWQLGDLIRQLLKTTNPSATVQCANCGLATHDVDANFCKTCGAALRSQKLPLALAHRDVPGDQTS
jgi:voltage-gated potassium channel